MFDLFRNRNGCLPVSFANRESGKLFAGRLFNHVHARAFVDHNVLRSTIECPVFAFDGAGYGGFAEDERVIYDHFVRLDPLAEMPAFNKDKA